MQNIILHTRLWQIIAFIIAGMVLVLSGNAASASEDLILAEKMKAMGMIPLPGILTPADEELEDLHGNRVRLSDFKGKIVFLNFWTTWCPDCVYEMPDIEKLHQKIKDENFIVIALDLKESAKKVNRFKQKYNLTFNILLDKKGSMGRAFGVRSIPTTFVLNPQGGLIGKALGPRDWGSRKSQNLFEYIIKNK